MNSTLTNLTFFGDSEKFFAWFIFVTSVSSIQFLLGFSLYFYIIILLLSKGGATNISVVFTLNYIAAEILYSLLSLLYVLIVVIKEHFKNSVVQLMTFFVVTTMSARLLFLCCITFERYLAVVHPVSFLRFKPLRYRVACSVLGWTCVIVLGAIACAVLSAVTVLEALYIIILAVEFFCCVSILSKLRHQGLRNMEHEQGEMSAAKKKAFQIVSVNLLTCLIQNIPFVVSFSLVNIVSSYALSMVTAGCTAVNLLTGLVQPVFILHRAGKLSFTKCP